MRRGIRAIANWRNRRQDRKERGWEKGWHARRAIQGHPVKIAKMCTRSGYFKKRADWYDMQGCSLGVTWVVEPKRQTIKSKGPPWGDAVIGQNDKKSATNPFGRNRLRQRLVENGRKG